VAGQGVALPRVSPQPLAPVRTGPGHHPVSVLPSEPAAGQPGPIGTGRSDTHRPPLVREPSGDELDREELAAQVVCL
jgi:hypothetical protein